MDVAAFLASGDGWQEPTKRPMSACRQLLLRLELEHPECVRSADELDAMDRAAHKMR